MDTESLKVLVEIFQGVGADTKYVVLAVLLYYSLKFVLGMGVIIFLIIKIYRIVSDTIQRGMIAHLFQHDLGYYGEIRNKEREEILTVWELGLQAYKKE